MHQSFLANRHNKEETGNNKVSHGKSVSLLPLMWGTQANRLPQSAEWRRCFIHFLSISQCESLASVKGSHDGTASQRLVFMPLEICWTVLRDAHAHGLLQSKAQARKTKVHWDTGNIVVNWYKWEMLPYHWMSHWAWVSSVVDSGVLSSHSTGRRWQEMFRGYVTVR